MSKVGRPKKEEEPGTPTVSLEEMNALMTEVTGVVNRRAPRLCQKEKTRLIESLALEMAYLPEMIRLSTESRTNRRGPKWKPGTILLMQVLKALRSSGVDAPEWKNSRNEKNVLTGWCEDLVRATKIYGVRFSARQAQVAKVEINRQIPVSGDRF